MIAALLLVASLGWADADAVTTEIRPRSRQTVQETVNYMILLLEAKKYRQLFDEFGHPETLADAKKEKIYEHAIKLMAKGLGDKMLQTFQQMEFDRLKYNADRSEATYDEPAASSGFGTLTFAKHEGAWYIKD